MYDFCLSPIYAVRPSLPSRRAAVAAAAAMPAAAALCRPNIVPLPPPRRRCWRWAAWRDTCPRAAPPRWVRVRRWGHMHLAVAGHASQATAATAESGSLPSTQRRWRPGLCCRAGRLHVCVPAGLQPRPAVPPRHRRLAGCAGPALPLAQACRFAVSPPAAACAQRPSHATSTCFLCFPLPAVVAAALAYVMWGRYARTGKLMPAGMVAGLRCGGCRGRAERGLAVWRWLEDGVAAAPTQPLPAISCLLPPFPPPPTSPLAALSPHPTTHPLPCSAAMCVFYLWNLLLFSPTLPPAKQH